MKLIPWLGAVALLAFASLGAAEPDRLAQILQQQRELQATLDGGGGSDLTPREVRVVRDAQKQVFAITDGRDSLSALSVDEKVRLENALERINAIVKGGTNAANDARTVCWRERKLGSKVQVSRCGTEADRDALRQAARDYLAKPRMCPDCSE